MAETFGQRFARFRKAKGFTQDDGYPNIYENGLLDAWIELKGSDQSVERVWDKTGTIVAEAEYLEVRRNGDLWQVINPYAGEGSRICGYGKSLIFDADCNKVYESQMIERVLWADARFSIVLRGNYMCVFDADGGLLYKRMQSGMEDD